MRSVHSIFFAAALAGGSVFAGTTFTCVGPNLLLVDTVGDSGAFIPGRGGVLHYKDQLVERHHGQIGDQEVKWEKIAVARKRTAVLTTSRHGNVTVAVTREQLEVKRTDGQPLVAGEESRATESVVCSDVREFRPVP